MRDGQSSVSSRSATATDSVTHTQVIRDIANLKSVLASGEFYWDLDEKDAAGIQLRRQRIEGVLGILEAQLQSPQHAHFDTAVDPPSCYDGFTLNNSQ